jgi:phage terminase large subunit-like protein
VTGCKYLDDYIELVKKGPLPSCKEQFMMIDFLEEKIRKENLTVDEEQAEKYFHLQKYFPYDLFPWEIFCFTVHNCLYRQDGRLRFPELFIMVGRGNGKNGYLSFEDFALMTPVNTDTNGKPIKNYDIDIFANSEDQAKVSFTDIYNVIDADTKLQKHFYKTKEMIRNLKTGSVLRFRASNSKTGDSRRPGKVDFDEYHQYEDVKLIEVSETGLGKKPRPRKTIISTNGYIRGGPFDDLVERSIDILNGVIPDNGMIPFISRLDKPDEVHNKRAWHKACPSLRYFPDLQDEMERKYADYKRDPIHHSSFMVKRMNIVATDNEAQITAWENIKACCRDLPDLEGMSCIGAIDYSKVNDFVAAGLLFCVNDLWYWMTHTWICKQSADYFRIRYPMEEAQMKGILTIVDEVEIPPELPAEWLHDKSDMYDIYGLAIDSFRYQLMKKALVNAGFDAEKDGRNNIKLVRPSDIMKISPVILSKFSNQQLLWGKDNSLMNWYTNNAKTITDTKGNISFGKIEPKSRKTDGFMALVHAATRIDEIEGFNDPVSDDSFPDVFIF